MKTNQDQCYMYLSSNLGFQQVCGINIRVVEKEIG